MELELPKSHGSQGFCSTQRRSSHRACEVGLNISFSANLHGSRPTWQPNTVEMFLDNKLFLFLFQFCSSEISFATSMTSSTMEVNGRKPWENTTTWPALLKAGTTVRVMTSATTVSTAPQLPSPGPCATVCHPGKHSEEIVVRHVLAKSSP